MSRQILSGFRYSIEPIPSDRASDMCVVEPDQALENHTDNAAAQAINAYRISRQQLTMRQDQSHKLRAAGILPLIFLCLITALGVLNAPPIERTSQTSPSEPASGRMAAREQLTAAVVPKRPFVVDDYRTEGKAPPKGDGGSKFALSPMWVELADSFPAFPCAEHFISFAFRADTRLFSARAPPAFS